MSFAKLLTTALLVSIVVFSCDVTSLLLPENEAAAIKKIHSYYGGELNYKFGTKFNTKEDENGSYMNISIKNSNIDMHMGFAAPIALMYYNALPDTNKNKYATYEIELSAGSNTYKTKFTIEDIEEIKERTDFSASIAKLFTSRRIDKLCDKAKEMIPLEKDSCFKIFDDLYAEYFDTGENHFDSLDVILFTEGNIKDYGLDCYVILHQSNKMTIRNTISMSPGSDSLFGINVVPLNVNNEEVEDTEELDEV